MPRTKLQTPNFSLTKRSDGYYDVRYTEDGTAKKKSTGTKNAKEAEGFRARFADEYRRPKITSKHPTIREVCDAFQAYREPLVASPLKYFFNPIRRHLGDLYADKVTQTVVNRYTAQRRKDPVVLHGKPQPGRTISDPTINKDLKMLRAALNWAAAEQLIEREPTFRIELSSGGVRSRWITKEEANRIMDSALPHAQLFILIALSTAKRMTAILSLKWSDVTLHMQGYETLNFGDDVGNKRRGSTPISGNDRLIEALKAAKKVAKTDYVVEFQGKQIKEARGGLISACTRAGIEPITPHVLKHSSVSWMVMNGTPLERIAAFTNTSKDIIERVYGKYSPAYLEDIANAVSF
ncbi:tyrosine-type recombinase/integrase [Roseomonas sp. WA12]